MRKNSKTKYCYLVQRKADGEKFCTYGNFKVASNRPTYLFEFVENGKQTKFGKVKNVSSDLRYNSNDYSVIRQYAL